ncbi:MAG: protein kinase [Myxococcales bacterium]|nr:protein kinase [Myxococcales bacterium]MCB9626857.1 protein kinase [Sandaracinaceae bacterium]
MDGGALRDLPDPLIGRTIAGRYLIQERIGQGGMGTVYRARHEVVGRDVALKFLSSDLAHRPAHKTRFLREARAANRINHEHIIDITDFGETDDGLVYLAMEFLDGVPLNKQIAKRDLNVPRALGITLQVARALGRAHELGVIHRDIKPDNIYLLQGYASDFVKLLDFGLAQMKGELRVTATGTVFGTPEYIAPEQARGAPLTYACDLYSLGCVLFEMLTNELPFKGGTSELVLGHLRTPPPAPSSRGVSVPPELDALVLRLLSKQPEARHPSAYALASELSAIMEAMDAATVEPIPLTRRSIAPRSGEEDTAGRRTVSAIEETLGLDGVISAWENRLSVLDDVSRRAHVGSAAPPWLDEHLARMRAHVEAMTRARARLHAQAGAITDDERQVREQRLQIGRALDALGGDEARAAQLIDQHAIALGKARMQLDQASGAWSEVRAELLAMAPRLPERSPSDEQLSALVRLGQAAARQLGAKQAIDTHMRDLAKARAEHDDIRFQMSQLKGRMGSFTAGAEVDINPAREELAALEREIREHLDLVLGDAEPVVRHLMSFPHLRDRIRAAAEPATG